MNKKNVIFLLILLLLSLYGCISSEAPKDHLIFSDEISPYIIIKGKTKHIYNFEDKLEETTTFDIILDLESNHSTTAKYDLDLVNVLGEVTNYQNQVSLPSRITLTQGTNIGGNGLKEYLLKVNDINFYEKIIPHTDENLKSEKYYRTIFESDDLDLEINITEDEEKYSLDFTINANDKYHIDFQSYLASTELELYSFLGIYNYSRNKYPFKVNNNYIYKEMDIEYLYIRIFYYNDNNQKKEINVRYSLEQLINKILD